MRRNSREKRTKRAVTMRMKPEIFVRVTALAKSRSVVENARYGSQLDSKNDVSRFANLQLLKYAIISKSAYPTVQR